MNRRKFFGSFAAIGAIPVAAAAKAMQDDPVAVAEDGSKVINGDVRINGTVSIVMQPGATVGLSVDMNNTHETMSGHFSRLEAKP